MLLQEIPVLDELIVVALVNAPGATAKSLWSLLGSQGHRFTLRAVYKELAKLIDQGILFKRGETYNIRLAWVMNLLALGDRAYEQYTSPAYLTRALGIEGTKRTERFRDLVKLDRLWTQLILALHQLHPGRVMCFWCPYQWFYLAHSFTCKQFYDAIDLAGHRRCHIIGVDTFLARRAVKDLPKNGRYSFAKSPFDDERTTYYTVVADRIITVKIDKQTTAKFDRLFHSVRTEADIQPTEIEQIFSSPVTATLTIEEHHLKAAKLKRKFSDFFGEPIE